MTLEEKIQQLTQLGLSQRAIASSCQCSRKKVITIQKTGISVSPRVAKTPDQAYCEPDFEIIHAALASPKMTLMVQWENYVSTCRIAGAKPYMYSRFADLYRQFTHKSKATMHLESQPGEILETDWAGTKGEYINRETGEIKEGSLAKLDSGNYLAEALNVILTGKSGSGKSWIACALGNSACRKHYSVRYIKITHLLEELKTARKQGKYRSALKRFQAIDLLVLDGAQRSLTCCNPAISWKSWKSDITTHIRQVTKNLDELKQVIQSCNERGISCFQEIVGGQLYETLAHSKKADFGAQDSR